MNTSILEPNAQNLAQQLVDLRREISDRESRANLIKRRLLEISPQGSFQCTGGKVAVVQATQVFQIDKETLTQLLFERGFLTRMDAAALIEDGKIERPKDAYVSVRLDPQA